MHTYRESDLTISFSTECKVCKFDEHRFFRWLSGSGIKGVDFLVLCEKELFLLEIKNFNQWKEKAIPEDLFEEIEGKKEGTLKVIRVVHSFFLRKWSYRLWKRWVYPKSVARKAFSEWYFWTRALEKVEAGCFSLYFLTSGLPQENKLEWESREEENPPNRIHFLVIPENTSSLPDFILKVL
jgi:hypothetical protein